MKKKNSKSADLKKLAMLGLAAGLLMPGQSLQADSYEFGNNANFDHYLAGGGCAAHGCQASNSGNQGYYQNSGQQYSPQYSGQAQGQGWESQNWQAQSGCHANPSQQQWQAMNSCNNRAPQQNWQAQSSCNNRSSQQNWQAQNSCHNRSPQQNLQAQSSCGANSGHYYPSFADNSDQNDTHFDQNSTTTPNTPKNSQANNGYRSNYAIAESDTVSTSSMSARMTESELMNQLNAQSKAQFQSLSAEGKTMALKLANQDCKGKNDCKGQGSCKSAKNDCAGKNGCKGQSVGPFKDKNVAVKVAAMKMAEKRNNALKN